MLANYSLVHLQC